MNILITIILIAIQISLAIYFLQQFFNKFSIKYGKVKISDKQKDGTFIEQVIETNKKPSFNFIFGVPGSGKTTACAYYASVLDNMNKQLIKKGKDPLNIYANIYLKGINYTFVDRNDIGIKKICDGILLIDESSIDWNNRNTKNMQMYAIRYFKKHRHYNVSVFCFSQSYDDTDITLRRLADNYYHIYKSPLYFLNKHIILRGISKFIFIEKERKEIIEGYKYKFMSKYRMNAKKYFKYFNSYERDLDLV